MKYIDKFLKTIGASRNTFVTYVFTLITFYIAIDRIVEILLMIFTGVAASYWGPIKYTLALACPMVAYMFSPSSEFAKNKPQKVTLFFTYVIGLSIIACSMFMQWLNMGVWLFLISTPGYVELVTDFSDLIRPAITTMLVFIPFFTAYKVFHFIYMDVRDSKNQTRSIWDYTGINLSDKSKNFGTYSCSVYLCTDDETGKTIKFPESSRFQATLVCGGSGSGKTALIYEPLIARDIEKKSFYRDVSKELGFTALKSGIASLNGPYDNDYLNEHFSLSMLSPSEDKQDIFNTYMKKMTLDKSGNDITYRDCGITVMSPDYELINHMTNVCKNFNLSYNIIDPMNTNSIGLNPFVYDDPSKIAITISSILRTMSNDMTDNIVVKEAYQEDIVIRAIENLAILLKEIYPRMHEGSLPNLNDMLQVLTNFDLVEKMCEILAHDQKLSEKYSIQLAYFKKNFFKGGSNREATEKYISPAITQLDNLLRIPNVKSILCNRRNNLDFDKALANAEITFICTRRGDLGSTSNKAFGLFFLMSLQNAILRRKGNENNRIPHFLYIDEFPDFICKAIEPLFTMYRKYKVGTMISIQNLSQLDPANSKQRFRETILSNCTNKIFTGNAEFDEIEWWSKEFGKKREWTMKDTIDFDKMEYESKHSDVKWEYVNYFKPGKLQTLTTKKCAYKIRGDNGKPMVGPGNLEFLSSKYKEPHKLKTFDFGKYSDGVTTATEDDDDNTGRIKFNPKKLDFKDDRDEYNPVQTDITDLDYMFDDEDAIVVNLKKNKKK